MAGGPGNMPPLEHIGAEAGLNEQAVRGTGTGGRLIQSGGPHPLLYLQGDRGDEGGGWNNGGGFNRLIGALGELWGESIRIDITRTRTIGQAEFSSVPWGLSQGLQ